MAFKMNISNKSTSEVLYNSAEHMALLKQVGVSPDDAYDVYERESGDSAYVMKPVMDTLSITIPLADRQIQRQFINHLQRWHKAIPSVSISKHNNWRKSNLEKAAKHGAYKKKFMVTVGGFDVLIQAKPENKNNKFFKICMQPSLFNNEHMDILWKLLDYISGGVITPKYVAAKGNVTQIDWAIDYINVPTDDLIILKPGSYRVKKLYLSAEGVIRTDYIQHNEEAKKHKHSKAYMYDKANHPSLDKKYTGLSVPVSRVEFRTYPEYLKFSQFTKDKFGLKNKFLKYEVIDLMARKKSIELPADKCAGPEYLWKIFADHIRLRGRDIALSNLPADIRAEYKEVLANQLKRTWHPKEMWGLTPLAVKKFLYP